MISKTRSTAWREIKIIGAALGAGLLFALAVAGYSHAYAHHVQRDIADHVIRFHVRANSDRAEDQALKEAVRAGVLAAFEPALNTDRGLEATRRTLEGELGEMARYAADIVQAAGFDYAVSADISRLFFPTQFYGSLSFPPGEYEAVQIIIGEGAGSNWWCLMFPPLCYVDMTATESGRDQLQNTVSEEGFMLLTHQ